MAVTIVGAGIGGLTLALQLHARGIHCRVYEAVASVEPLGVGINVLPHAMKEMAALGIADEIRAAGVETAKNLMAFQKPDARGALAYRATGQTILAVARSRGVLTLWNGFPPYYIRCGGHTVTMFIFVEWLRHAYLEANKRDAD